MVSARAAALLATAALLPGCRGLLPNPPPGTRLYVPPEMRRAETPPGAPEESGVADDGDADAALRIAEGGRVYEVALPDDGSPVVVRVPLNSTGAGGTTVAAAVAPPRDSLAAAEHARRQAYVAALARIRELYASRRFDLALLEVSALAERYPEEARLWAMKGSLHRRLGQTKDARVAWERAQKLAPEDLEVSAALSDLSLEEGGR